MKTLILITTFLLLPGCLFFDSSPTTCEDTAKCSSPEVYGEFISHGKDCFEFDTLPAECLEGYCGGYSECREVVKLQLTNVGSQMAAISEPTELELYSSEGEFLRTIDIEELTYAMSDDTDSALFAEEMPTVKRVLELEPDDTVALTLFFTVSEPIAAKANIGFEIRDQNTLSVTTTNKKFGISPEPLYENHTTETEQEKL